MLIRKKTKANIKRGNFSKKIKKDYHSKSLNNPFFRAKKPLKNQTEKSRTVIYIGISLLILGAIFYLIFFSTFFKVTKIQIFGLERIPNESILKYVQSKQEKKIYFIFPQNRLPFINANKLANEIQVEFKLSQVIVKKKYLHSLEIRLSERPIAFIWQEGAQKIYSDATGCLIREVPVAADINNHYLILLSDSDTNFLKENDCLDLRAEYFIALLSLNEKLLEIPLLKPDKYILSAELNSLVLDLDNGPNIIFNTKEDLSIQVERLLLVRQDKADEDFLTLEYIDLRFGELIYTK